MRWGGIIGVLPEVQGAFQGRIDEQIQLGVWLTGDRRPRIMTIHGSGGQGKTALARVAVERFAHAWPGGVWSMTLETVPTRAVFVASLAGFLGIPPQGSPERADLERQIQQRLRRRRTLLVLDNLETLAEAARAQNAEALALIEFIQQLPGERTSLLCTSRHLLGWTGEQHLELPGLAPDEGAALFQQSTPNRIKEIELSLARELSRRVDGHPLGLSLLGRAFNESPIKLPAFLAEHETYLLSVENRYIGVDHRQRKMFANVAYSVRWLTPELHDTLSKLWVFHAPFLPNVAVAVLDPDYDAETPEASPIENHLYMLWQRGLVSREAIPVAGNDDVYLYRLPPVIRPYIDQYLANASERATLLARYGSAYANLADYLYRELDRGGLASALALLCQDDLERGTQQVAGSEQGYYLLHLGWILSRLGDRIQGLSLTEQVLEMAQELDQALALQGMNNMASVYRDIGKPQEALRLYEQALPIMREVGNRAGEAATLNNMAGVYCAIGKPQEALRLYEQALPITREVGNRAGEAAILVNMAVLLYQDEKRPQEAITNMEQALDILRTTGLPQDAAGRTPEMIERTVQAMRKGTLTHGQSGSSSTMPARQVNTIVSNTVAVMTTKPERRAEWREMMVQALQNAQQGGAEWQIEVDFCKAILAILDGQFPSLSKEHPYASAIATIQHVIANGGPKGDDSDDAPEEGQAWAAFAQACITGLRSTNQEEKRAFLQLLATLEKQAPDEEMKALFQTLQLALLGGDLAQLGKELTGFARQLWDVIVAGVQGRQEPDTASSDQ